MYKINTIKKIGIFLSLMAGFIFICNVETQAQRRYRDPANQRDSGYWQNEYPYAGASVAQEYGYDDGYKDGADAARERDAYNPENSGDWQKGTNGYEDRFGNKRAYKQAYRQAYMQGYREAYTRREARAEVGIYRRW